VSKKLLFDTAHLARNLFGGSLFRFISTKCHGRSAHTARNFEETSAKDMASEIISSIIPLNNLHVSVKFQIRRSVISKSTIKGTNYCYGLRDETATERGA